MPQQTMKQWTTSNKIYNALQTLRGMGEFGFSLSRSVIEISGRDLTQTMRVLSCAIELTETTKFTVRIVSLKNLQTVIEVTF